MPTSMTLLKECDIFLTRSTGLISRAIRFFTRHIGEHRSKVSHVGIVVEGGPLNEAVVIEIAALSRVKRHRLIDRYGGKTKTHVAIYRPLNLTDAEREIIVRKAEDYKGRSYGCLKLVAHFLDWILQGAYVFRRLALMDEYPICSWVVAHAFAKAGKTFGVAAGAASPDDIWDFVTENPDKYELIHPLAPLMIDNPS